MKEEKEINGEIWEKSPTLKNGFPDSGPDSNSKEAASEENSELDREWLWSKKKALSLIFPYLKKLLNFLKVIFLETLYNVIWKHFTGFVVINWDMFLLEDSIRSHIMK